MSPMYALHPRTYHGSISTLRSKRRYIRGSTTRQCISKDDNADRIHPTKLKNEWSQQTSDDIRIDQIDTEPQRKHLQVPACSTTMSLLGQHTRYTASFKPGQAFDPGVPSGELAFENGSGRDIMVV